MKKRFLFTALFIVFALFFSYAEEITTEVSNSEELEVTESQELTFTDSSLEQTEQKSKSRKDVDFGFRLKDVNPNPHELGVYFKDYVPVLRMRNHSYNFIGAGISYAYHSPFTLLHPVNLRKYFGEYWNVGFSGRFDLVGVSKNDDYIISWYTANLFGGACFEIVLNDWLEFQPSVEYGVQLDVVKSTRKANGPYLSQSLLISPTIKLKPFYTLKDNLSFDATPFWEMSFESDGVANYCGFRIGAMYRIGGKPELNRTKTE